MSRPRNIGIGSLIRYRFPLTAITSILHRITGVLLVISIPFWLWALMLSLRSAESFSYIACILDSDGFRFVYWLLLSMLGYHVVAGVKHLLMDVGHFETNVGGKYASIIVLTLAILIAVGLGVWLW